MERDCPLSAPRALWERAETISSSSPSPSSSVSPSPSPSSSVSPSPSSSSSVSPSPSLSSSLRSSPPSSSHFSSASSSSSQVMSSSICLSRSLVCVSSSSDLTRSSSGSLSCSSQIRSFLPSPYCRPSACCAESSSAVSSSVSVSLSSSTSSVTSVYPAGRAIKRRTAAEVVSSFSRVLLCSVLLVSLSPFFVGASPVRSSRAVRRASPVAAPSFFSPTGFVCSRPSAFLSAASSLARDSVAPCLSFSPASLVSGCFPSPLCVVSSFLEKRSSPPSSSCAAGPLRSTAAPPLLAAPLALVTWPGQCPSAGETRPAARPRNFAFSLIDSLLASATAARRWAAKPSGLQISLETEKREEPGSEKALESQDRGDAGDRSTRQKQEKRRNRKRRKDSPEEVDEKEEDGTRNTKDEKKKKEDAKEDEKEGQKEEKEAEGEEGEKEAEENEKRLRLSKALKNVLFDESLDLDALANAAEDGQRAHQAWEVDYKDLDPSGPFQQEFLKAHYRRGFRLHEADCGSEGFQVASLTARINYLTQHMVRHRKDLSCVRGLRALVVRRRKHLQYLARKKPETYLRVLRALNLKPVVVPGSAAKFDKRLQYACFTSVKRGPKLKARKERERRLASAALEQRQRRRDAAASEVTRAFAASLKVVRSHAALLEHTGAAPDPSEDGTEGRAGERHD
ncbi:ribosomal protein RPS15 [Toxoplasma gondii ME49]|uniref:Ribosomal protein RPS15 n=3 Tax=Toxoplasma gondii TaxID=5811 RepID=A0A125YT99_TOXGV|nr:ribosomal protein RPS15 [Toxoplasma gondii ME49]EPT25683.1 ribosomal protein RPS15 [Toxoplasma gondii ME49]ESS35291.1 ribosomal protein RPS15 [Toxoplasma gondii VEG]|eukprot:XP_018635300.1 ribosomal protein RPS15 [Toxoplasma gondii ME49]